MKSVRIRHSFYLLLATLFWGTTFVAQSVAMDSLEPYTYNVCRFLVGFAVLLPLGIWSGHRDPHAVNYQNHTKESAAQRRRSLLLGGLACGICIFLSGSLQQIGLVYTTAGKSGFLTAMYILLVPVFGLFLRRRCPVTVWMASAIAVVGLYFLCITENVSINKGDVITLCSAAVFAVHILVVDRVSPEVNGVQLSAFQFLIGGLASAIPMLLFESPSWESISHAWGPILYAGIFSCGLAYTLQIIGQRDLNPTVASLLMSLESCIAVISSWLILGDTMSGRELLGCVLMFCAIILAQLPEKKKASDGTDRRKGIRSAEAVGAAEQS